MHIFSFKMFYTWIINNDNNSGEVSNYVVYHSA